MRRTPPPPRVVLAVALASAMAVLGSHATRAAAAVRPPQAPPRRPPVDSATLARVRAQLDSVIARRTARGDSLRLALAATGPCSDMPVVPGDTAHTRMPVALGDTAAARRPTPWRTALPPCAARPAEARVRLVPRRDSTGRRLWELRPAAGRDAPR